MSAASHASHAPGHGAGHDAAHDGHDHHPAPVPRDPDLPVVDDTSITFFAAGALAVFVVALFALLG